MDFQNRFLLHFEKKCSTVEFNEVSVITSKGFPSPSNSGEILIESLMGSSQVALNRRFTTEQHTHSTQTHTHTRTRRQKKRLAQFCIFFLLKMHHTKCYISSPSILSNDFPELWIQYSFISSSLASSLIITSLCMYLSFECNFFVEFNL